MKLSETNKYHPVMAQLGFTYNEAEIFLYLTKNGECAGSEIITELTLDKSSFYRSIKSLVAKQLIYVIGEERNRKFGSNSIQTIEALVRAEEKKVAQAKKSLVQLPQLIQDYVGSRYEQKNITVINDAATYTKFLYDRLQCQSKLLRDISGKKTASVYYPDYDRVMADFVGKRVKAGINIKQLSRADDLGGSWDKSSQALLKEVRVLPDSFEHQAVLAAWDDMSVFFSKDRGNLIGVAIKDAFITQLVCSMFDYIWDNLASDAVAKR